MGMGRVPVDALGVEGLGRDLLALEVLVQVHHVPAHIEGHTQGGSVWGQTIASKPDSCGVRKCPSGWKSRMMAQCVQKPCWFLR
jgi:hypothetical protein